MLYHVLVVTPECQVLILFPLLLFHCLLLLVFLPFAAFPFFSALCPLPPAPRPWFSAPHLLSFAPHLLNPIACPLPFAPGPLSSDDCPLLFDAGLLYPASSARHCYFEAGCRYWLYLYHKIVISVWELMENVKCKCVKKCQLLFERLHVYSKRWKTKGSPHEKKTWKKVKVSNIQRSLHFHQHCCDYPPPCQSASMSAT